MYTIKMKDKMSNLNTPRSLILFYNAAHNEWHCQTILMGNWTENHNLVHVIVIIGYT